MMQRFANAEAVLERGALRTPVRCRRPHLLKRAADFFTHVFPGAVLYAVKANDAPYVLEGLFAAGIRHFDVASLGEIERVSRFFGARLYLMTPVKSRHLISAAYHQFGVRDFALDCHEELAKIAAETKDAADLGLFVRLSVSNEDSQVPLDGKFGIDAAAAVSLLQAARDKALRLGLSFHVGSQALAPARFSDAVAVADEVARQADVKIDVLDVGGGFPALYAGTGIPPLDDYFSTIHRAVMGSAWFQNIPILAEPGRALVAEAESLIVQVIGRKGQSLYIDDGIYGTLFEAAEIYSSVAFPVRRLEIGRRLAPPTSRSAFCFFGPTCDSVDALPGPFFLPADMAEGDYLEIGHTGAYGRVSASGFNGFSCTNEVELTDAPFASFYAEPELAGRGGSMAPSLAGSICPDPA